MTRQIKPPQGGVGDALQSLSSARCFEATRSPSTIVYRCSAPLALTPSRPRHVTWTVRLPDGCTGLRGVPHHALKTALVRSWFRWAIQTVLMQWIEPSSCC